MTNFKPVQIRIKEAMEKPECPYAYRWVLNLYFFSIRLHHFLRSDDKRFFHNHGWNFITLVLKGSYTDVSPNKRDLLTTGSIRYRNAKHAHYVEVSEGGVWTFLITGPMFRKWGFLVDGRFKRPLKYFHKFGHPPCEEQ